MLHHSPLTVSRSSYICLQVKQIYQTDLVHSPLTFHFIMQSRQVRTTYILTVGGEYSNTFLLRVHLLHSLYISYPLKLKQFAGIYLYHVIS